MKKNCSIIIEVKQSAVPWLSKQVDRVKQPFRRFDDTATSIQSNDFCGIDLVREMGEANCKVKMQQMLSEKWNQLHDQNS